MVMNQVLAPYILGAKNATFCDAMYIYKRSFYQDRLGTNIGKVEKRVALFAGERLSRIDIVATVIIVAGIVLSTAFGVHTSATFTIEKLLMLWSINLRACPPTQTRARAYSHALSHLRTESGRLHSWVAANRPSHAAACCLLQIST